VHDIITPDSTQTLSDLRAQVVDPQRRRDQPGYAKMLGSRTSPSYKSWGNLVHPDDMEKVHQHHMDHFAGRKDFSIAFRMKARSGEWHWIHSRGLLIERDSEGKPLRMVGTHTDIHDLMTAQERLRNSEERFRKVFYSAPQPILVSEMPEGRIVD
jgi:PAS domain-containing protein